LKTVRLKPLTKLSVTIYFDSIELDILLYLLAIRIVLRPVVLAFEKYHHGTTVLIRIRCYDR
jgi:hypothetical protein